MDFPIVKTPFLRFTKVLHKLSKPSQLLAGRDEMSRTIIDGIEYIEIPDTELPIGNVCLECAFYGTDCYNRNDFTCHSDARPDGIGIIYKVADQG